MDTALLARLKSYYDQNGNNAVIIIKNNVDFTLTDCKGTGTITHKQGVSGEGVIMMEDFSCIME